MKITWTPTAWNDYIYWQQNDKSKVKRINELIKVIGRTPFEGIGKPEALKHDLKGFWSRRIDGEHRLVYTNQENAIVIVACRYHY